MDLFTAASDVGLGERLIFDEMQPSCWLGMGKFKIDSLYPVEKSL